MEVAFQAKLTSTADGEVTLDEDWFSKRLEDCEFANSTMKHLLEFL
jgi:hypothetical protein